MKFWCDKIRNPRAITNIAVLLSQGTFPLSCDKSTCSCLPPLIDKLWKGSIQLQIQSKTRNVKIFCFWHLGAKMVGGKCISGILHLCEWDLDGKALRSLNPVELATRRTDSRLPNWGNQFGNLTITFDFPNPRFSNLEVGLSHLSDCWE